jgi:hypothetical protein
LTSDLVKGLLIKTKCIVVVKTRIERIERDVST